MATLPWIMSLILMMLFITLERKNGVEASHTIIPQLQSLNATSATQFYRTGYHFQPPQNWINDPNGLMYYKGIYHLFYQYNTKGVVWGNIVWGHSVSTDLINWFPLEPAISPDQTFDCRGTWSGSVTFLPGNKPTIMYTGLDSKERQMQNIAEPKDLLDPFLREWIKPTYNPIIEPENGINSSSFRDPTTAWRGKDGLWRTIVGNKRGDRGVVLLFKSRDFIRWTKTQQPLHSAPNTGMWECPDFFPVSLKEKQGLDTSANDGVKHVLKVSLDNTRTEYYTVGQYNENTDRYVPDNTSADNSSGLRFDYGNFYGSKTFFDESTDRRILFGWANESDTVSDDILKGWAGIQTIPRTVLLDKTGRQLVQWPVEEIKTLRGNKVELNKMDMKNGSHFEVKGLNSAQADVEVIFELPSLKKAESFDPSWVDPQKLCGEKDSSVQGGVGPFGLLTLSSKNMEEYTPVFFRVFKAKDKHVVLMCSGGDRSSLKPDLYKPLYGGFVDVDLSSGMISLRSLIDNSVVESFGAEGKVVITSRIYPLLAIGQEAHLHVFNNGTETIKVSKLKAWTMKKPFMN